jgi:hypothetical protein
MSTARRELDRMSDQAWGLLAMDVQTAGRSMGRVGLSYARRHPALLLGGGALLGAGVVGWFNRSRRRAKSPESVEAPTLPKAKHVMHAVAPILKNMARMWIVDVLTAEFRGAKGKGEPDRGEADEQADTDGRIHEDVERDLEQQHAHEDREQTVSPF